MPESVPIQKTAGATTPPIFSTFREGATTPPVYTTPSAGNVDTNGTQGANTPPGPQSAQGSGESSQNE